LGRAHAEHDVLDDVNGALPPVNVHMAILPAPFSPCVVPHVYPIPITARASVGFASFTPPFVFIVMKMMAELGSDHVLAPLELGNPLPLHG
jgi:hypothetical protein